MSETREKALIALIPDPDTRTMALIVVIFLVCAFAAGVVALICDAVKAFAR